MSLINTLKHFLWFTLFLVLGCEVGGWVLGETGGWAVSVWGFVLAWPALLFAALYTEYRLKKERNDSLEQKAA